MIQDTLSEICDMRYELEKNKTKQKSDAFTGLGDLALPIGHDPFERFNLVQSSFAFTFFFCFASSSPTL